MNLPAFRRLIIATLITALSFAAHAEDDSANLHVLRTLIHADRDKAEVCFEADRLLDIASHAHIASTLQIDSEDKSQSLAPQNIVIDANSLCILGLEHRRDYTIKIPYLRGAKGEKLSETYADTVTIPDWHASLDFIGSATDNGLLVWRHDDPVLRAVNIDRVHVELYQMTDIEALGEAWRQRLQTTLAPSESAYFARHNGTMISQEDIELPAVSNMKIEQPVILNKLQPQAAPGLYLLVASAPQAEAKTKKLALAPLAAIWLLRSNLDLRVVSTEDGFYALTEQNHGASVVADVRIVLQDHNQKLIAEARSDHNGMAFLSYPEKERDNASTVIGMMPDGNIAFADLNASASSPYVLPAFEASLATDKSYYQPQEMISAILDAHDIHGQALAVRDSSLRILRSDQSLFTALAVPSTDGGHARIDFPAPSGAGLWSLVWSKSDGTVLAQAPLRLTSNTEAPYFEITADRSMLPDDGDLNLTIKSVTHNGSPAPYLAGRVAMAWIIPDKIFPEFSDYTFSIPDHNKGEIFPLAAFVTDGKGVARLHVKLGAPERNLPIQAAQLTVVSDKATGALVANPLIVPVRPKNFIVGIKTEVQGNHFPENSLAHFALVALDANGKRRAVNDLSYQVFEEGRHFDWYTTEGHWDYKPLRQERRLGGAPLSLSAQDANIIEWPVSAGTYRLEVMNADGAILARLPFSAGWGLTPNSRMETGVLTLVSPKDGFRPGQAFPVHFSLPQPSVVTAIIADDEVRQVLHGLRSQGDNTIDVMPQQNWGRHLSINVLAPGAGLAGHTVVTSFLARDAEKKVADNGQKTKSGSTNEPLIVEVEIPALLKRNDIVNMPIVLTNMTSTPETYHYSLSISPGIHSTGPQQGTVSVPAGQKKEISFELKMAQQGIQFVRLDITGSHNVHIDRNLSVAVTDNVPWLTSKQSGILGPQQLQSVNLYDKKQKLQHLFVFIGQEIPISTPEVLSAFVRAEPFLTQDIALWLETFSLWHPVIVHAGLLSEEAYAFRQQGILRQFLSRQTADGGFSSLPHGESDLASTVAAIYTLKSFDMPSAKLALEQSVSWLQHYLENSWFDETERPLRAAAYAALAAVDHLDVPSLYYFSDNSKSLPPLAAVQLAQAFMTINDQPKAQYWLKTVSPQAVNADNPALLEALSANPLTDLKQDEDHLDKTDTPSAQFVTRPMRDMAAFLKAIFNLNNRAGQWHVLINGTDRHYQDLQVIPATEKIFNFHNMTNTPLRFLSAYETDIKPVATSVTRHLYLPNGIDITSNPFFKSEDPYVMVLQGPWPKDDKKPVVVSDEPSPALYPASCALSEEIETDESLAWIKQQPLNRVSICETTSNGLRAVLDPEGRSGDVWRIAYFIKAGWTGSFKLSQARIVP